MKNPLISIGTPKADGKFDLPADGFVQVFPFGEWDGAVEFGSAKPEGIDGVIQDDAGRWFLPIVQVLDRDAAAACAAKFRGNMLLDYEHASDLPEGESRAGGWAENAEVRDDGLYLQVRWSADGLSDVSGGNYRFLSPVFPWSGLEALGGNRFRPTALEKAALTNVPRLRGIRAVSNSQARAALNENPNHDEIGRFAEADAGEQAVVSLLLPRVRDAGTAPELAGEQSKEGERKMREQLIKALGLPPEATDEQIVQAVSGMQERLSKIEQDQLEAQVENDLKQFGDRVADPAAIKEALLKNRAGTLAVLKAMKPPEAARAMNADNTRTPEQALNQDGGLSAAQKKFVAEVKNRDRCDFAKAWDVARREKPELFKEEKKED
jgi:phage I-like protein